MIGAVAEPSLCALHVHVPEACVAGCVKQAFVRESIEMRNFRLEWKGVLS
jgi:hypothetical protein